MTLTVIPEALTTAAADVTRIGTSLSEAHALAAPATTSIAPAAADEVSTAIAAVFGNVGQFWQGLAVQAAAFHQQFTAALSSAGELYTEAERDGAGLLGLNGSFSQRTGVSQDVISIQTGPSVNVSSSIPFDLLAAVTNTGIPVIGPALDGLVTGLAAS
jgi:phage-related protein